MEQLPNTERAHIDLPSIDENIEPSSIDFGHVYTTGPAELQESPPPHQLFPEVIAEDTKPEALTLESHEALLSEIRSLAAEQGIDVRTLTRNSQPKLAIIALERIHDEIIEKESASEQSRQSTKIPRTFPLRKTVLNLIEFYDNPYFKAGGTSSQLQQVNRIRRPGLIAAREIEARRPEIHRALSLQALATSEGSLREAATYRDIAASLGNVHLEFIRIVQQGANEMMAHQRHAENKRMKIPDEFK